MVNCGDEEIIFFFVIGVCIKINFNIFGKGIVSNGVKNVYLLVIRILSKLFNFCNGGDGILNYFDLNWFDII